MKYPSQSQSSATKEGGEGTGKRREKEEEGDSLNSAFCMHLAGWWGKENFYIQHYMHILFSNTNMNHTHTHTQKYLPYLIFSIKNNNNHLYVNIAQYYCMSRYLWSPEFIPFSFYVWSVLLLKSVFFRLSKTRRLHKHSSILMNGPINGYDYIASSDFFKDIWTWRSVIRDDQNNFSKCLNFD